MSIASRLFGRQFLKHDHVLSLRVCFIYDLSRDEVYLVVPGLSRLSFESDRPTSSSIQSCVVCRSSVKFKPPSEDKEKRAEKFESFE